MNADKNRRELLLAATALCALPALLLSERKAAAFSIQDMPAGSPLGLALQNHCSGDAEHAALRANLQSQLAGRGGLSGSYVSATETCPVCGCPITETRYIR